MSAYEAHAHGSLPRSRMVVSMRRWQIAAIYRTERSLGCRELWWQPLGTIASHNVNASQTIWCRLCAAQSVHVYIASRCLYSMCYIQPFGSCRLCMSIWFRTRRALLLCSGTRYSGQHARAIDRHFPGCCPGSIGLSALS